MSKNNVLSASGSVTKKELVRSIKIKSGQDYIILESADPFPQVDYKLKKKVKLPKYFYIGIIQKHLDQDILLSARNAERDMHEDLNSAVGTIVINEDKYNVIRLKNIPTRILANALDVFQEHGIKIVSFNKNINDTAIIHTRKFFYLEEIEQGFYMDLDELEKGYVEVPRRFKWAEFEEISENVRSDCRYTDFDGAIGEINKHGLNQNMIRIYSPQLDTDKLLEIGKGYIKHLFV
jgi:hypothetical protein